MQSVNTYSMKHLSYLKAALLFIIIFSETLHYAQVQKNVVVEHFTNTVCSICASRNPGFFTNLNNHPDVLHVSFYPSAPYSSCVLHNYNSVENDGRTNFYGIYGSTPRLVISGDVIPSGANYSSASLFTPYLADSSSFDIDFGVFELTNDSVYLSLVISKEDSSSLTTAKLFAAISQDTLFYNAPNGENEHINVFRQAFTDIEGQNITLPNLVGETVSFTFKLKYNSDWDMDRLRALIILQNASTNEVLQSDYSNYLEVLVTSDQLKTNRVSRFAPNPAVNSIKYLSTNALVDVKLTAIDGRIITPSFTPNSVNLQSVSIGLYIIQWTDNSGYKGIAKWSIQK